MGKHFLPQAHLRRFSSCQQGFIYVYDIKEQTWRSPDPLPISKVAQASGVWDDDTERRLERVERPGLQALGELCRGETGETINRAQRCYASLYLAMMMGARSHSTWEDMARVLPNEAEKVVEELRQSDVFLNASTEQQEDIAEWLEEQRSEAEKGPQRGRSSVRARSVFPPSEPVFRILVSMRWTVLHSSSGCFVISDTPVQYTRAIGVGDCRGQIWAPLSERALLLADWRGIIGTIRHQETREASKYNRLAIQSAYREVYSSRKFTWIPRAAQEAKGRTPAAQTRSRLVECASCGLSLAECRCEPWGEVVVPRLPAVRKWRSRT